MAGPRLARYEILEELGSGGMSVVFRARDKQLSRSVAVKVLHDFLAKQPEARQRFHREAVAVAKLHHPGILEIFDYSGPDASDAYIVTELIEGVTLRAFIDRKKRLEYPEIGALIVAELCRALKHAHDHGVIHRDLKPENVMVTREGTLKLMDFGIAQLQDGQRVTVTGTLLGSPAHMAPEVIDGQRPDARADLFSLGTILYWLATGELPYDAPNPSALFKRILDGSYEDPQVLEPKIGNGLARIIRRALEPDREQRYPNAGAMLEDLVAELTEVELAPTEVVASRYFADPDRFARELGPKLVAILTRNGKEAMREKNLARAMDRFNRVLAIEPDSKEARALVANAGRRQDFARRARAGAIALGSIAAIGGIAWGTSAYLSRPAGPAELQAGLQGSNLQDALHAGSTGAAADGTTGATGTGAAATGATSAGAATAKGATGTGAPATGAGARTGAATVLGAATAATATGAAERSGAAAGSVVAAGADAVEGGRPGAGIHAGGVTGAGGPGARGAGAARGPTGATGAGSAMVASVKAPRGGSSSEATPPKGSDPRRTAGNGARDPMAAATGGSASGGAAGASDTQRADAPEPAPIALKIRIRNSFGDVKLDGRPVLRESYGGVVELTRGKHVLTVEKPGFGSFRARSIEVEPDGDILELRDDGTTRPILGEILFVIPKPGDEASNPDWTPAKK